MEAFDIKKLLTSPVTPIFWVKVIMFSLGAIFLFMVGRAVYLQYFAKPPVTQEQHIGNITVQPGGNLNLGQQTVTKKWPWYIPHPFTEVYLFKEKERDGWGLKFGGRWEL